MRHGYHLPDLLPLRKPTHRIPLRRLDHRLLIRPPGAAFLGRTSDSLLSRCGAISSVRDGLGEELRIDVLGIRTTANAGVQRVNGRDLFGREREVEDPDVLRDARRPHRLRNRRKPVLDVPAQDDLRRGLAFASATTTACVSGFFTAPGSTGR